MEHAVLAVLLRPPLSDADREASNVEQVQYLAFAQDIGIVADQQLCVPFRELRTVTQVCRSHANPNHVFAHGWLAALDTNEIDARLGAFERSLNVGVFTQDVERLAGLDFCQAGDGSTGGNSGILEGHARKAITAIGKPV